MNQLSDKILKDYLLGKCTARQMEQVSAWVNVSDENARWLFRMEELFHAGHTKAYTDEARIQRAELRLVREIRHRHVRKASLAMRWMRYAAVLAFCVFLGAGAYYMVKGQVRQVEVIADTGVMEVSLPDGSKVWLNKNARLTYPERFSNKERKAHLEGEARFEVVKNAICPFIVQSDAMSVRVLGTVFNFNSCGTNECEEVTLLEGKVEATGRHGEGKIVLSPNQKVILDKKTRVMATEQVYAPLETLWYSHKLPFKNMRITDIIHVLEECYHVSILLKNMDVNATYSGCVEKTESIESVLDNLMFSIPFTYQRKGNHIYIVGT